MNPIAFNLFGMPITWYGLLISTGILIGLFIAYVNSKYLNISFDKFTDYVLISLPFGIIGARLYYVLFNINYYKENLSEIINIRQGGLAIHGGIIFAILTAYIYSRIRQEDILKYLDLAAPSIIIAQAIGRWGNFFNQEAHGGEVTYDFIKKFPTFIQKGMYIEGKYYHPTFLYESIWNFIVFLILLFIVKNVITKKGNIFFIYIGLYSLGRFFIEGLRTDSLMFGPLRAAQIVSLAGILISIVYILFKNTSEY